MPVVGGGGGGGGVSEEEGISTYTCVSIQHNSLTSFSNIFLQVSTCFSSRS